MLLVYSAKQHVHNLNVKIAGINFEDNIMKSFDEFGLYIDVQKMEQIRKFADDYADYYLEKGKADLNNPNTRFIYLRFYSEGITMGMLKEYHKWLEDQ